MFSKSTFTLFYFILFFNFSQAQVTCSGFVKNQKGEPLKNANVLFIPLNKTDNMSFSIVKDDGSFTAKLKENSNYKLTISYIGYVSFNDTLVTKNQNIKIDKILIEDLNELQEVTIKYKPPVIIKKDTTIYDVSKFSNGKERKIKELLNKLPGVEVDRNGNVTHNGKKITKVLVDNKQFFTGQSKMAVENIPADVVGEIEMIEDYHETAFLKGLEDSNEIAMNIKLKEGKKNFLFGDIETGVGVKERYKLHPSVFKYGSKTTYNFIGDINNTAQKSFTLSDYISFEGGIDGNNTSEIIQSDVSRFLRNIDFNDNNHKFGGLNIHITPNDRLNIRTFIIGLADQTNFETKKTFEYINDNTIELRESFGKSDNDITLGKIRLRFTPNIRTSVKISSSYEKTNFNATEDNSTLFNNSTKKFKYLDASNSRKINFKADGEKQFSKQHTSTIKLNFKHQNFDNFSNWLSETNFFSPAFPIVDNNVFDINQSLSDEQSLLNYSLKHYWIINNTNHLYASTSSKIIFQDINSNGFQQIDNSSANIFDNFQNILSANLFYSYSNLEYKRIIWDAIVQFKLQHEYYNWYINQMSTKINNSKTNLLPTLKITYDIDNKKNIVFNYTRSSNLSDFRNFIENNRITSFNSTFTGNPNLKLNYFHGLTLHYKNYNTYGFSYFPTFRYRKRINFVARNSLFDGIYNTNTPFNLENPNESFYFGLRTTFNKPYWKAKFSTEYDISKMNNFINSEEITNTLKTWNIRLEFNTKFEEYPNIDLSYKISNYINENNLFSNNLKRDILNIALNYDVDDWKFNIDYENNYFQNEYTFKTTSRFDDLNASIYYQKENSPWGFELRYSNITNNKFRQNSFYSSTILQENQNFVFPSTLMFLVNYKL